jgi:hypothetical protein
MSDDVLDAFLTRGLAAQKAVDELDVVALIERAIALLITAANANSAGDPMVSYALGKATGELEKALRALGHRK